MTPKEDPLRLEDRPTAEHLNRLGTILCCPKTKGPLRLMAADSMFSQLPPAERERLPPGTIAAFVSEKAAVAYPATAQIVSFLDRDAVPLKELPAAVATDAAEEVKRAVREWYDTFGWQKNESGEYHDTAAYSQTRPVGHGLYEFMSHLSLAYRLGGGDFILDAASGAIAHPEYLSYSWFYRSRVCVDMSVTALREAATKIRPTDFCCLADITSLPFRDGVFDGAVSGYTIQHIPEAQQATAVGELVRVLRPGARLYVMSNIRQGQGHRIVNLVLRNIGNVMRAVRLLPARTPLPEAGKGTEAPPLYFLPRRPSWWKEVARQLGARCSVTSLRLLNRPEFERAFGSSDGAAKAVRMLERTFPRLASGPSAYCTIEMTKV